MNRRRDAMPRVPLSAASAYSAPPSPSSSSPIGPASSPIISSSTVAQRIAGPLPGDHAAIQVPHIRVPEADQGLRGCGAHAPAAAVEDDLRVPLLRKLDDPFGYLVIRDEQVRTLDLPLIGDVDVHQRKVLAFENGPKLGRRYAHVGAAFGLDLLSQGGRWRLCTGLRLRLAGTAGCRQTHES